MNKSLLTNVIAILLIVFGLLLEQSIILWIGIFAFSGAVTNWLAVHMLFEKVPGLVGSGIIPNQFEALKKSLHQLVMEQFFKKDALENFIHKQVDSPKFDLAPVIEKVDLAPAFERLVNVIMESSFGSMLSMFGGASALSGLQEPFETNMRTSLVEMTQSEKFVGLLEENLEQPEKIDELQMQIEQIVEARLNELTPQIVKQLMLDLMGKHLSWLVVWGGVFGGVIGGLSTFLIL